MIETISGALDKIVGRREYVVTAHAAGGEVCEEREGFQAAPRITSVTSMPSRSNDRASSLTKAILISRKEFSTTLTASVSRMDFMGRISPSMMD